VAERFPDDEGVLAYLLSIFFLEKHQSVDSKESLLPGTFQSSIKMSIMTGEMNDGGIDFGCCPVG
jgi:hypothetical protein